GFPEYASEDDKKRNAENAPTVLNPSNGKPKEGATFDLGSTIAGSDALQPGALSNPFVIRLQLVDATKTPNIRLKPTGMVPSGPASSKAAGGWGGAGRKSPLERDGEEAEVER